MTIVPIADLKARVSEYLRRVRRGEVLTVLDRETPIARIVPHDDGRHRLTVRHPAADAPAPPRVPVPPPLRGRRRRGVPAARGAAGPSMIAYVDSSILLRIVRGQARPLREWGIVRRGVASALVEVERLRTIDRLRRRFGVPDHALALRGAAVFRVPEAMEVVEPARTILARGAHPLPTALGAVDAIHLATAMIWRELRDADLVMATHDAALGTAARACGPRVVGIV